MSLIHTPITAFKPVTDAPFVPEAPFKLGKQEHPNYTLLYKDKGEPTDADDPFAIVFSVERVIPRPGYYMAPPPFVSNKESECLKHGKIGMIKHHTLPPLFYVTDFESIEEAIEQVEYFFSLSETQQLLQLKYERFNRFLEQDVHHALVSYKGAIENLDSRTSELHDLTRQIIEPANTLLKTLALYISPFSLTCSAFQNTNSHGSIILYEHVMSLQIAIRNLIQQLDHPLHSNSVAIAYGGLRHAITCLEEVVQRPAREPSWNQNGSLASPSKQQW
jgi:hypothetical protein